VKLDLFGNKARGDRVSCLAAQLGANWCRSAPHGEISHGKNGPDDHGQDWAAVPLAIVDKTLAG
jgi:hypothetical protein